MANPRAANKPAGAAKSPAANKSPGAGKSPRASKPSAAGKAPVAGKPPEAQVATMIANLKDTTGRPLPEWLALVAGSGLGRHSEIVAMLKAEHGVSHGYANQIALTALRAGAPAPTGDDLVAAMYAGDKQALLPIWAAIEKAVFSFGVDVDVSPKKTYVSLRRNKQFALVQPTTRTRVDIGICLKDTPCTPRLEQAGSFNEMVTHRVRVEKASDIDAELVGWLRKAYKSA